MTTSAFTLSYMLRNSGTVLEAAEHTDVKIARRDGSDLLIGTVRREAAVRDGLEMAARVVGTLLADPQSSARALSAIEEALPWTGWLSDEDRLAFAVAFVRSVSACRDTGNFEPLAKLLNGWQASAQIAHSPELTALLLEPRGEDELVSLTRPSS